ncbi:MAG: hypothetical protein RL722_2288 [Pseudomonadota bacterium]|jgi:hypothetical protein
MPVVFRHRGWRFFFYSNEGDPREPLHIHVRGVEGEAKFWVKPEVSLARSDGLDARTLRELAEVIATRVDLIERTWNDYFA